MTINNEKKQMKRNVYKFTNNWKITNPFFGTGIWRMCLKFTIRVSQSKI